MNFDDLAVVLFDGDCAFCNGTVRWLLRHERAPRYRLAALQSEAARPLLAQFGVPAGDLGSVLVIDHGRLYRKTAAVLHLLRELRWPWPLMRVLVVVPRFLRDPVYDFVGARRYRWWGRADRCVVADPALRARVLVCPSSSPTS